MNYCYGCGSEIPKGHIYCEHCDDEEMERNPDYYDEEVLTNLDDGWEDEDEDGNPLICDYCHEHFDDCTCNQLDNAYPSHMSQYCPKCKRDYASCECQGDTIDRYNPFRKGGEEDLYD